jgi:hypothetical protein
MPGAVNVALRWVRAGGSATVACVIGNAAAVGLQAAVTAPSVPVITSPAFLVAGTVDTLYPTTTFTATGSTPITWTSGALPAGMAFSSAGVLSGTPTATASASITFTATNAQGADSRTLTLTVNAAGSNASVSRAPYITNTWLPDGRLGVPYLASISFTGTSTLDGTGGIDDTVITIDPTTPITPLTIGGPQGANYRIAGTVTTDRTIPVKINISNKYGSSSKTFSIRFRADESSLTGTPVPEYGPTLRLYRGTSIDAVGSTVICDPAKWQLENYMVNGQYNIQREWKWYRNGSYLHAGVIHTITTADIGATLFCRETAYRATSTNLTATQDSQTITVASGTLAPTLVYPTNLSFVGAFKSPDSIEIYYGGMGLAFNSANTSLYISKDTSAAEITIPTGLNPAITAFGSLPNYSIIQPITDVTEGGIAAAISADELAPGPGSGGDDNIVGLAVYNNRLIVDAGNQYTSNQTVTHWSRPLSFSTTGNVLGPATVSNATYNNPRWSTGPMALLPADKASVNYFGSNGKVLVGWAPDSSISLSVSGGPSVFAFDPTAITGRVAVPSNAVLAYTQDAPIDNHWYTDGIPTNHFFPVYGLSSAHYGIVFPNGTDSILFIGRNGHGFMVYSDPANPPDRPWIYDPHGSGVGEHSFPWYPQIWAYDARELKAAYDAGQPSETVKPYAIWNFDWPTTGTTQFVYGAAYDPATRRIYISVGGENFRRAMIFVYEVTNAVAA